MEHHRRASAHRTLHARHGLEAVSPPPPPYMLLVLLLMCFDTDSLGCIFLRTDNWGGGNALGSG
jgi:hypothetical protein